MAAAGAIRRAGTGTGAAASSSTGAARPIPPPKDDLDQDAREQPQAQAQAGPKVSRYRSLRGKSVSSPRRNNKAFNIYRDDAAQTQDDGTDASPTRSRSHSTSAASMRSDAAKRNTEKRRQHGAASAQTPPLPPIKSPLNPKPVNLSSPNPSKFASLHGSKSATGLVRPSTPEPRGKPIGVEAQQQVQKRKEQEEAARWADEVARLEAETDRILAEQKKRDLARLQAQLAAAPSPKAKPKRLILDKLTFLRSPRPNTPGYPTTPKSAPAKILAFNWSPASPNRTPSPDIMSMIQPGGKGIVPQTDAPTSASNGGERVSEPLVADGRSAR